MAPQSDAEYSVGAFEKKNAMYVLLGILNHKTAEQLIDCTSASGHGRDSFTSSLSSLSSLLAKVISNYQNVLKHWDS